jgi:hypothetical protein
MVPLLPAPARRRAAAAIPARRARIRAEAAALLARLDAGEPV